MLPMYYTCYLYSSDDLEIINHVVSILVISNKLVYGIELVESQTTRDTKKLTKIQHFVLEAGCKITRGEVTTAKSEKEGIVMFDKSLMCKDSHIIKLSGGHV